MASPTSSASVAVKTGMDLSALGRGDAKALVKFAQQVATVTARTRAARSATRPPSSRTSSRVRRPRLRAPWAARGLRTARAYRRQLLLDFECFRDWAHDAYPPLEGEEDDGPAQATTSEGRERGPVP